MGYNRSVDYIKNKPSEPTFTQKGFKGYKFPLFNKNLEVAFVDVTQGHDNCVVSKDITHIYYILEGKGSFTINDKVQEVGLGTLIEVPPDTEFAYSGNMKLLLVMNPPWYEGHETIIKSNPNVKG